MLVVVAYGGYDAYDEHADNLYRVTTEVTEPEGSPLALATTSPPIAEALWQDYPEVKAATRLFKDIGVDRYLLAEGTDSFYASNGYYVDSSFFQVFSSFFSSAFFLGFLLGFLLGSLLGFLFGFHLGFLLGVLSRAGKREPATANNTTN